MYSVCMYIAYKDNNVCVCMHESIWFKCVYVPVYMHVSVHLSDTRVEMCRDKYTYGDMHVSVCTFIRHQG